MPSRIIVENGQYKERLARAFESVTDRLKRQLERQLYDHNRKANFIPFQQGEMVWLKNWRKLPGTNAKLQLQ